jgi:hypothetical protein
MSPHLFYTLLANVLITMSNFDRGNDMVKSSRFHLTGLNFNQKQSNKLISKLDKIYKLNLIDIKSRTI